MRQRLPCTQGRMKKLLLKLWLGTYEFGARREAIKVAYEMANSGDIILIAGKGHEKYQIIGSEKIHFDDLEEIIEIFKKIQE